MKKVWIGTIVGAILIFLWQFLSWSMLPVHQDEFRYTANQDAIIEALSQNLTEDGQYMIPNVPPGTPQDQHQEAMKAFEGKPWAHINYHQTWDSSTMGMNMARGFAADLVAVWLLVWLLMRLEVRTFLPILLASLTVGVIGFLTVPYLNSIWFETSSMGYIIDTLAQWGLVGAWLGWWLPRP